MTWAPCKSGAKYTSGNHKGKPIGHTTEAERQACKFCRTEPTPPAPGTPGPAAGVQGPSPAPTPPVQHLPSGKGPQPAGYAPGTAEVQSPGAAERKAKEAQDYTVDGPHTLMFWNEVVFYWLGTLSDALDAFVWKVKFHVDKSKLAVSPFATSQINKGETNNMYTRLATRACKLFKVPSQKLAHTAIEDAAFMSQFSGALMAFGSHYLRISKESPRLKSWRENRAKAKAEREAKRLADKQAAENLRAQGGRSQATA